MNQGILAGVFDNSAINTMRHNLDGSTMQVFADASTNDATVDSSPTFGAPQI